MLQTPVFVLFLAVALVSANFDFFGNMFGGQHSQQQQQQPRSGASQWAAHLENTQCSQYLCPMTLDCVSGPHKCPCPNVEDIECVIPDSNSSDDGPLDDGTVLCARGEHECAEVKRLMRKWA